VNVYASVCGEVEHLYRKYLTERDDHSDIKGAVSFKGRSKRWELLAKRGRLKNGDSVLKGEFFDWGDRDFATTARWSIGLGENRSDRDIRRTNKSAQRRD
jgi:hypothetical protein